MPTVRLEYGDGQLEFEAPADATVVVPGETFAEPPPVDPREATHKALSGPLGIAPITDLVGPGSKIAIAFPDRVKGGTHEGSHRKVTLPLVLDQLRRAGVRDSDIHLICAIGLHRKNTKSEMLEYLPAGIVEDFSDGHLVNHDAEDPDGMVDMGGSALGDKVDFNRRCAEADLCVVLGHAQGNPYGGFSGGYKTFTTGLTSWRSIRGHHTPGTMHRADFVPISPRSHFRSQLRAIGERIESSINGQIFVIDAVVGNGAQVLGTFAGTTREVEKAAWPLATQRTNAYVDSDPADVVVFGLPRSFHYGPGMGTNPILMTQAIASTISRVAGALRDGAVAIVASECDGWFNDDWFPSYKETFDLYSRVSSASEMVAFEEEMSTRPEYIDAYRNQHGYHPFHAFSMLYMGAIGLSRTSAIYVVGAREPGKARAMGLRTARSFQAALSDAAKYVGDEPRMLVLPGFLKSVPPHLFSSSTHP